MNRRNRQAIWLASAALAAALLILLPGCALFNQPPIARISASVLSGTSPLAVIFDASASIDPDGSIVAYLWDFGDGETANGVNVSHAFTATTETVIYTVTLTVTDDQRNRTETTQTIEVHPGDGTPGGDDGNGGEGFPVARFTRTPLIGRTPLAVTFDAIDSTPGTGTIDAYNWDFGDGSTGTGRQVTHTYTPTATREYTVTLMVWNSVGVVDAEQHEVIVIVPEGITGDEDPVADVTVTDPDQIYVSPDIASIPSLFEVSFDPRGSYADAGHELIYYAWDFGDGETQVETEDLQVTHIYQSSTFTRTYMARLTVYDDQGLFDTMVVNVTVTHDPDAADDD